MVPATVRARPYWPRSLSQLIVSQFYDFPSPPTFSCHTAAVAIFTSRLSRNPGPYFCLLTLRPSSLWPPPQPFPFPMLVVHCVCLHTYAYSCIRVENYRSKLYTKYFSGIGFGCIKSFHLRFSLRNIFLNLYAFEKISELTFTLQWQAKEKKKLYNIKKNVCWSKIIEKV